MRFVGAFLPRLGRVVALAFVLAVPACTVSVPILGAGPSRPDDPWLFDDAVRGARAAGYHEVARNPDAGTFEVIARTDGSGATHFVVQCFSDGWVSVIPEGPGVRREGDRFVMPARLREEYATLTEEIASAIVVWP